MKYSYVFLVFVAVCSIVFYVQHNYQALITLLIISLIFSILFFLRNGRNFVFSLIKRITHFGVPPHQRVEKIIVGDGKPSIGQLLRVKKQDKKILVSTSNRDNNKSYNGT